MVNAFQTLVILACNVLRKMPLHYDHDLFYMLSNYINTKIKIAPSIDKGRILIGILVTVSIYKGIRMICKRICAGELGHILTLIRLCGVRTTLPSVCSVIIGIPERTVYLIVHNTEPLHWITNFFTLPYACLLTSSIISQPDRGPCGPRCPLQVIAW